MNNTNYNAYEQIHKSLQYYTRHPEEAPEWLAPMADKLFKELAQMKEVSCHSAWGVKTTIRKYKNDPATEEPWQTISDEVEAPVTVIGNIITDGGANEMLKLIFGIAGAQAYNSTNARIFVGSNNTPENASQTGIIATSPNAASASLISGYPQVTGRSVTLKASFGAEEANFAWNEISLKNGASGSAVALNRKVASMGTKSGGVWTVELVISVVEM